MKAELHTINEKTKPPYDYIGKCIEGRTRVKNGTYIKNLLCGYVDENFNEVIPLIYTGIKNFSEGLAAVKIGNWANGKWGFIDKSGKLVIPYIFDKTFSFSDGYTKVVLNGKWCFIDKKGVTQIDLSKYDRSSSFHNGFATVEFRDERKFDRYYTIIDKKGNKLFPDTKGCMPNLSTITQYLTWKGSKYYKYLHGLITIEEFKNSNF